MALTTSMRNAADIVNAALVRIGYDQDIGSLHEGSKAASLALDTYGEVRDELMRRLDPGFAQNSVALVLLKSAPAGGYFPPTVWSQALYPQLPWTYEYAYPDECLRLKAVKPTPLFLPEIDPLPNLFAIANDNTLSVPPAISTKVILCNVPSAIAVMTARITDPTVMDADFSEAWVALLAERLAPGLAGLDMAKAAAAEAQIGAQVASMEQG